MRMLAALGSAKHGTAEPGWASVRHTGPHTSPKRILGAHTHK